MYYITILCTVLRVHDVLYTVLLVCFVRSENMRFHDYLGLYQRFEILFLCFSRL